MRWIPIIIGVLLLVIGAAIGAYLKDRIIKPDTNRQIIKEVRSDRDSLLSVIKLKTDTINNIYQVLQSKDEEIIRSEEHRKQLIQHYESIRFRPLTDHQRDSLLAILYPSFHSVR